MYKVRIETLQSVIKQLEANNKILASLQSTPALNSTNVKINKLIKANNKQIEAIKNAAPILA